MSSETNNKKRAVRKFREYLRIKTVHPNPDYTSAVKFLDEYAAELGLPVQHVDLGDGRVAVVMTLAGKDPLLTSVVLHSHTDVVPVFEDQWKHDPWVAFMEENGDIYGRGTQDMKSVGIQYVEAVRILKKAGRQCDRNIHIVFLPDEEIACTGVGAFVESPQFEALNAGFILDEGLAHPENKYSVFYAERGTCAVRVKCQGQPGHGSRFIENTAAEKLKTVLDYFLAFRKQEEDRVKQGCSLGDVTTVNLTLLEGGVQTNVVPKEFTATFDIRVPPTFDKNELEGKIKVWCEDAGDDVTYAFIERLPKQAITSTSKDDPWWKAFSRALEKRGVELSLEIFAAGTNSCVFRELGLPAIGFSPMRNTPIRLHDNDEFLSERMFLEGIEVYLELIPALANVTA